MANDPGSLLVSLPVRNYPGYSVRTAMETLSRQCNKFQRALEPPFFKKILGGTNKDYARSVCAVTNEYARIVRGIVLTVRSTVGNETNTSETKQIRSAAIEGICSRILTIIDEWRNAASDFEANNIGSLTKMIETNKKLLTFAKQIEHPAAGLQ